ncbi:MAG TPA: histidine kinase [bacterium]|nr:histidine kinase [bacterium]
MRIINSLFVITALIRCDLTAQEVDADSLLRKLRVYPIRDSARVEILTDICAALTFKEPDSVLIYAEEALIISKEIGYEYGIATAINCRGMAYYQKGDLTKAMENYLQASDYVKQHRIRNPRLDYADFVILNNIAIVYNNKQLVDEALAIHFQQIELLPLISANPIHYAALYTNIGGCYGNKKMFAEGIRWFEKVDSIAKVYNIPYGTSIAMLNIAANYNNMKLYSKAITSFRQSLTIAQALRIADTESACHNGLGVAYSETGRWAEAVLSFEAGAEVAKRSGLLSNAMTAYQGLARAAVQTGDFRKAYEAQMQYQQINDSLLSIEKTKSLQELITRYETEKKEITIREQQERLKVQSLESDRKNILIVGIILLLAVVGGASFFYIQTLQAHKKNEILSMQMIAAEKSKAMEVAIAQSELKGLKSQMNPHFIYNVLNSIQSFVYANQKNEASENLSKFSDLMRKTLENSGRQWITLHEETEYLSRYLELEALCADHAFQYEIVVDPGLDPYTVEVPAMVIQPFAENAIKHGLLHKSGSKKLSIRFEKNLSGNDLRVVIEDNGIGRAASAEINARNGKKPRSFATQATAERIALLSQLQSRSIVCQFTDEPSEHGAEGTRVDIVFPLEDRA